MAAFEEKSFGGAQIAETLESARSRIEGKFSEAGSVLERALSVIGNELELLQQLNGIMGAQAVEGATQDLISVSTSFKSLPGALEARRARLGSLETARQRLSLQTEEMRRVLKYLLVFAMNLKIAGAETSAERFDFPAFAKEMMTRLAQGQVEIGEFDARLANLDEHIQTARAFEVRLAAQANEMLPSVPDQLAKDAATIWQCHQRTADMTSEVSRQAQNIQQKVVSVLSALQIGDITRQRIEHVQQGLGFLAAARGRLQSSGADADAGHRFERFVYGLLAAQLSDAAEAFQTSVRTMVDLMSAIAGDTSKLVSAQREFSGPADGGADLRSLEASVARALDLVSDMEKASESAHHVNEATSAAVGELASCVDSVQIVKEDVRLMSLNATIRCSRLGNAGRPLEVIGAEVRLYAKKLEETSEATRVPLKALTASAVNTDANDRSHSGAREKLENAVACLRNAADIVDTDLANLTARGQEAVELLNDALDKLNFEAELVDVLSEAARSLALEAGDHVANVADIAEPLRKILEQVAPIYTMAREREIHASFAIGDTDANVEAA